MKYKTVSINYTRKVNLGNYEAVDASCYLSAEVEEGDILGEVMSSLIETSKRSVFKALESEMSDDIKVILQSKICGKLTDEKEVKVLSSSNKKEEKVANGNSSIIAKFSKNLEEGELYAEFEETFEEELPDIDF